MARHAARETVQANGAPADVPVLAAARRTAVLEAMRALPERQREVLALHYLADLPVAEIATTLRVPEGTVKSRLMRGREALAAELGKEV